MTSGSINEALALWAETAGGQARLINFSENHVFRVEGAGGRVFILRIHRAGYHLDAEIDSELDWLVALRAETGLCVPEVVRGRDGCGLQHLRLEGTERQAVLFRYAPGREPAGGDDYGEIFARLGAMAALAHTHAQRFGQGAGFTRPIWDAAAILAPNGIWGDWRRAPGVDDGITGLLVQLETRLRADFKAYGRGSDRFGLIHADMRPANLLIDGEKLRLIDFDDCGFGWFVYDFAAALSFRETAPEAGMWRRRWVEAYIGVRALGASDIGALDSAVMLRRMALLAWIGSHGETALARQYAPGFAAGTAALARTYLAVRPRG